MENKNSLYWSISPLLSHNCLFNFVIGGRSTGKTFAAKKWAINSFLNKGHEFCYVRRYKDSDMKYIGQFFDDIAPYFPDHYLCCDGERFIIDDQTAGWAIPLSTSISLKSTAFPNVQSIIFDEFIIEKGKQHYLKNEVETLLDLYVTIARERDVKLICLSNALSITNPYFQYFDLEVPYNGNFWKNGELLVEMVHVDGFIERRKKSRFGQVIRGTRYERYSIENEFLLDNPEFIQKRSADASIYCGLMCMGVLYGVWVSRKEALLYISEKCPDTVPISYSLTLEDHTPNRLYAGKSKPWPIRQIESYFELGRVRFENQNTKNVMLSILKLG